MAVPSGGFTRLAIAYFTDWFVILVTIGFAGSLSIWATPSARPFSLADQSISYPHQNKAKISTFLLLVLAVIVPMAVCIALSLFVPTASTPREAGWRRRVYAANKVLLGLLLSVALSMLFTDSLKNLMGKPRPDLLSRCNPVPELLQSSAIGWDLVTWDICASKGNGKGKEFDDLRDGFRSFPSGHSSLSFAGLTYTTFFLASFVFSMRIPFARNVRPFPSSTLALTNPAPQPKFPQMLSFFIIAFPMFIAIYVASTRWSDYRHHGFDVLFGSFEGIFCALVGWGWYGVYSCRRGGVFQSDNLGMVPVGAGEAEHHPVMDYVDTPKRDTNAISYA